jgi:hypothetical protein
MQRASEVEDCEQIAALVAAIAPLFKGKSAGVQGAALADLLAMWLAGHVYPGEPGRTGRRHDEMIEAHLKTVRALIPLNYALQSEPQLGARLN